jgi:hypothetical protein
MKTNILKIAVIMLALAGGIGACGNKEDGIDFSNIENLHAQSLPVIQECVQGRWLYKGTHGGHSGWTPATDSMFIEITDCKMNGNEFQWVRHTKQDWDWQTPFDTYAIQSAGHDEPSLYFHSIRNDSLNVGFAPNRSCYDCFTGELWIRYNQ